MSLEGLFDKLDELDPGPLLIEMMDEFQNAFIAESECVSSALRVSVETAKWSARQNPDIAVRYCRELGWTPRDLAVMMIMQCSNVSMTSGEFVSAQGVLTKQGEGFRVVTEHCLSVLVDSGRIETDRRDRTARAAGRHRRDRTRFGAVFQAVASSVFHIPGGCRGQQALPWKAVARTKEAGG